MTAGAVIIWLAVIALAFYVARPRPESFNRRRERLLIIGGGAIVPTVVLATLLVYGLAMLPDLLTPAPAGGLKIMVYGEQWWWRVRYQPPGSQGGESFELANEIRLPAGEPVHFQLQSHNVIHSFWVPPSAARWT
jgi:cytochrome c oxidase subunit 2